MSAGVAQTAITQAELDRRVIEPADFVADTEAFVDVRIPRSRGKASYSFIGPGVSQNSGQTINLVEPHGYNVGAASMPHGVVNNAHLHYTAEVFICTRGRWRFFVGEHGDQEMEVTEGMVFSCPPWVFRGFSNEGPDDGFVMVVLGGDDTGGIIWAPAVLREAAETGMFLGLDNSLIDAGNGDSSEDVLQALTAEQLASVDHYSDDELAGRAVAAPDLQWSDRALLSSVLSTGHEVSVAPVLGHGLSQDRHHRPPISGPHGFALEWLRVAPGSSTGLHRHDDSQVVMLVDGDWEVALNGPSDEISTRPATGSLVSIPASAWRDLRNVGSSEARGVVVTGGDGPTRLEWSASIVARAAAAGFGLDAAGYLAPVELLGRPGPAAQSRVEEVT